MAHATARTVAPIGISHHRSADTPLAYALPRGAASQAASGARQVSQRAFAFPLRTRARSPAGPVETNLGSQMNKRQQRGEELGLTLLMSLRARWGRSAEMLWIDGDPDCG